MARPELAQDREEVECGTDRYWCELHDGDRFRVNAYLIKNGESIRTRLFATRDKAIAWGIAAHDSILRNWGI